MRIWAGLLWAAVLLLPWYGFEHLTWSAAMPLVAQVLAGRWWLAPLVAAPLLASTKRPGLWIGAAVIGLGWLAVEGLAIIHHGWGFSALAAFGPGPSQPALGWGALVYATACLAAKGGSPALLTPVESEKAATGQGLAGIKGSEAVQTLLKCAWLEAVNGNKLTMPQIAALLRAANLLAGKGDV